MTMKILSSFLLTMAVSTIVHANKTFKIPLSKTHATTTNGNLIELDQSDSLPQRASPRVGGWAEAEMWNGRVKEPLEGIGNFIFTGDV